MVNKYGVHSGKVLGKMYTNDKVTAITAGATPNIDARKGELFTLTPGENETITVTNGVNGQNLVLVVTTSGTTSRTLTFSTGFKVTDTLATGTTTAKVFTLTFKNVNGTFYEVSRTAAM